MTCGSITRLRLRVSLQNFASEDSQSWEGDLDALSGSSISSSYASGGDSEALISCPLDQWVAELVASYPPIPSTSIFRADGWRSPCSPRRAVVN